MSQAETILEIKDLCVEFQTVEGVVHAVDHLNYTLHKGEKLGIVGESGSGKSVSSLGMMQLIPNPPGRITGGEILYHGKDLVKASEKEMQKIRGNEISMIFQDPMASLNERAKVDYIVSEGLLNFHMYKDEADREAKVQKALREVGLLPEFASRFPHEFSGGQRQRIGIARALAVEPEFLVLDEPISALDVSIQAQVVNLLIKLQREMGLTYLFISHDLSMVKHISDRVGVMYLGSFVELASNEVLYSSPKHPYTQRLLSSFPSLTGDRGSFVRVPRHA